LSLRDLPAGRRLARALLDVSSGSEAAVDKDLARLSSLFEGSEELRATLTHPVVPGDKKKALVRALGLKDPLAVKVVDLLIERDRIGLLPWVASSFHELWNARRGVVSAEAISAVPLEPAQVKALEEAFSKLAQKEIELKVTTDAALLGGVLVKMGGRSYDGTVRSHLKTLRQALAGGSND
jgi:F-type H+-transporting ATPase subunit delta